MFDVSTSLSEIIFENNALKKKKKPNAFLLYPTILTFIPVAGGGVVGSVVFPTAGASVTLMLTELLKLLDVAEVGMVGVAGAGVGG